MCALELSQALGKARRKDSMNQQKTPLDFASFDAWFCGVTQKKDSVVSASIQEIEKQGPRLSFGVTMP